MEKKKKRLRESITRKQRMEEKPFGRRRQRQSPSCNPFKPNNLPMAARHTWEVSVLAARQRSRFELD